MRPAKLLPVATALLLAALFVVGCGGGGGDTNATTAEPVETTPTLTKQELIAQGDAICAEVNTAIGSVGTSAASTQSQITQVANLYAGMVESLKRLGTPEETAGYAEFIAAAEELATIEGQAKLAAEREDTTAIGEAATQAAPALEEFESVAGEYGFEECSEGPHAPTASGPSNGVGGSGEEGEEGGVEVAPEVEAEAVPEEVAPEEAAPEEGGGVGGGGGEEVAPEEGGSGGTSGGGSGGIGPG
ncbi:MAG TPA: hypothetical protein VHI77_10395 [Solirubrobacterales bacterium]|jgi:hypothetical protein|nr:hypothetical protein [Solirubrobacterales bacterium]